MIKIEYLITFIIKNKNPVILVPKLKEVPHSLNDRRN